MEPGQTVWYSKFSKNYKKRYRRYPAIVEKCVNEHYYVYYWEECVSCDIVGFNDLTIRGPKKYRIDEKVFISPTDKNVVFFKDQPKQSKLV